MDFELKDDDIRKIRVIAMAELRKEYYRWACWVLDGKFKAWAYDMIDMGIAIATTFPGNPPIFWPEIRPKTAEFRGFGGLVLALSQA